MTNERIIYFDAEALKQLLIHYTDGKLIPLDSRVIAIEVSRFTKRVISLDIESKDWPTHDIVPVTGELTPYEFIYEGKKTFSWTDRHNENGQTWIDAPDAPRRQ